RKPKGGKQFSEKHEPSRPLVPSPHYIPTPLWLQSLSSSSKRHHPDGPLRSEVE
uniref:Uncharacterized protein n=1 Tax=Aegilops tauschii subsp. strangulata TaxID=200361 RepID=A0A452Y7H4_AEGTS